MEYKTVKGFENYYVTKEGDIFSKDRYTKVRNFKRFIKGRKMKPYKDKQGYMRIDLIKDGIKHKLRVHRVVLSTYTDKNIFNEYDVNHIDGNKENNKLDNLEWCNRKENLNHAVNIGLNKQCIKLIAEKDGVIYKSNSIYSMYDVLKEVIEIKGTRKSFGNNILRSIKNNGTYYGFKFKKVVV